MRRARVGQATAPSASPASLIPAFRPGSVRTIPGAPVLPPSMRPTSASATHPSTVAALRRAIALQELHRRAHEHAMVVLGQALSAAQAQGFTTPITCSAFGGCPIYSLVDAGQGFKDLHPLARPDEGAAGLYADMTRRTPISLQGQGLVFMYPVAWIGPHAPGGAVFGWMPDGGFGVPPGGRTPAKFT